MARAVLVVEGLLERNCEARILAVRRGFVKDGRRTAVTLREINNILNKANIFCLNS